MESYKWVDIECVLIVRDTEMLLLGLLLSSVTKLFTGNPRSSCSWFHDNSRISSQAINTGFPKTWVTTPIESRPILKGGGDGVCLPNSQKILTYNCVHIYLDKSVDVKFHIPIGSFEKCNPNRRNISWILQFMALCRCREAIKLFGFGIFTLQSYRNLQEDTELHFFADLQGLEETYINLCIIVRCLSTRKFEKPLVTQDIPMLC